MRDLGARIANLCLSVIAYFGQLRYAFESECVAWQGRSCTGRVGDASSTRVCCEKIQNWMD